jgi:CelD/BcsL family acetyltransferase involved in cellulose biosynthesis
MTVTTSSDHAPIIALERTASAIASARRAALADRFASNGFTVEWVQLHQLESTVGQWRELAGNALEPNVFYEPAFASAAARVFGRDAGAVLVWSGTGPRKLLGFFPARIERRRYGLNLPVLAGWSHPYAPLGTPLVDREAAEPVIAAWLAYLAGNTELPGLLLLPFLTVEGPFAAALDVILRRAQMPSANFNCHSRALLAPHGDRSLYVEWALDVHKYKELRRMGRRLGDLGAMLFTAKTEPAAVAAGIEDFFILEMGGWKGRAGTAAARHRDIRQFIRTALAELAAERKVLINRFYFDGHPIAVTITLRSADTAWFWKIAYDEKFARYSPGVILTAAMTEELADDASIGRTDSCATSNHPMIDHVWRERLALCDRLIALRPETPFGAARRLELLRRAASTAAKRIRKYTVG